MSDAIKVVIRADADHTLGIGHFARATSVADALKRHPGVEILLATKKSSAPFVPAFFSDFIDIVFLSADAASPEAATRALTDRDVQPDVVYLDHYGEVPAWEAAAKRMGFHLVAMDDLNAARMSDVIVRPHFRSQASGDTRGIRSVLLEGMAYVPLSDLVARQSSNWREKRLQRPELLNICFGGSDPTNETAKALEALAGQEDLRIDVMIGRGARIAPEVFDRFGRMDQFTFHHAPDRAHAIELLAKADMALGAGGLMLWERLCLGVPSLVICVADNQRAQIELMAEKGVVSFAGVHSDVTQACLVEAFNVFRQDTAARMRMARMGRTLVDGRGAVRLAAMIRSLLLTPRNATLEDARSLLEWRRDARNWQHNWSNADKPDFEEHKKWLTLRLANPDCLFLIVEDGVEPVGVVRFDLKPQSRATELSIYLVPKHLGRKMGLPVYMAAEKVLRWRHPKLVKIVSRIHQKNSASRQLHLDAGFTIVPSDTRKDWLEATREF